MPLALAASAPAPTARRKSRRARVMTHLTSRDESYNVQHGTQDAYRFVLRRGGARVSDIRPVIRAVARRWNELRSAAGVRCSGRDLCRSLAENSYAEVDFIGPNSRVHQTLRREVPNPANLARVREVPPLLRSRIIGPEAGTNAVALDC